MLRDHTPRPFIGRKLEFSDCIPKGLAPHRTLGLMVGQAKKVE